MKKVIVEQETFLRSVEAQYPGIGRENALKLFARAKRLTDPPIPWDELPAHEKRIRTYTQKPCNNKGCPGVMHLEAICPACTEGKAGFQSSWTCDACFLRELSTKDFSEWFPDA
jgi:hypothetical protein